MLHCELCGAATVCGSKTTTDKFLKQRKVLSYCACNKIARNNLWMSLMGWLNPTMDHLQLGHSQRLDTTTFGSSDTHNFVKTSTLARRLILNLSISKLFKRFTAIFDFNCTPDVPLKVAISTMTESAKSRSSYYQLTPDEGIGRKKVKMQSRDSIPLLLIKESMK